MKPQPLPSCRWATEPFTDSRRPASVAPGLACGAVPHDALFAPRRWTKMLFSLLGSLPWLTFALAAIALAIGWMPSTVSVLQFDRAALQAGEWWRLVTGHFTHWSVDHLAWDLIVFIVFGALLEARGRRCFLGVVAGSTFAISAAVWCAAPQLRIYRGFSGIDSALYAAFFAWLLREAYVRRSRIQAIVPALALTGFIGKSAYEILTGSTVFVTSGTTFVPVPLAHLFGAATGVCVALLGSYRYRPAARASVVGDRSKLSRPP
jgi:rhomboid family GlyGly-CTERM serine protease